MKPTGTYHPPESWVKFDTLNPGDKFHDIIGGQPVQFVKTVRRERSEPNQLDTGNSVKLQTGEFYEFDHDEFVYPVDAGWIAELECYIQIPDEVKAEGHRRILAYVFQNTESRKADWRWREAIEKYFPSLGVMSFSGPEATVKWLMNQIGKDAEGKS